MKKLRKWISDIFDPEVMNDLDVGAIASALNDSAIRAFWLNGLLDELKRINQEVDRILLGDGMGNISDLCARRKTYQDILEGVLSARRIVTQGVAHNPPSRPLVDLDRVTG